MRMDVMLRLSGVSHAYVGPGGAALAVDGLDLEVAAGEFVSLVGPSGCGKTTILSLMAGLFEPTRGTVELAGERVSGPNPRIGYMLQQDYLFPWRNIRDNALIGFEIAGKRGPDAERRVDGLLAEFGLASAARRYPHELSGGMRQRAALVRTLAREPDVLLLDEPFSALDLLIRLQLEDLVWETVRGRGVTAVLVTHDLEEAAAMSDRVVILDASPGRIRTVLDVPASIRARQPSEARWEPDFGPLFHRLRGMIQEPEGGGSGHARGAGARLDSRD
jgi:NitT/TauT family transport system ATP-binding protein